MTQELSDNIKLIRKTLLPQSAALAAINQLVELVAEMREAFIYHKDVVGILPASSSKALTKADALLNGLKGEV
jgi:hypothetical protein